MKKVFVPLAGFGFAAIVLASTGLLAPLFSANYLPHRYCYLAKPGLIWTNVAMDGTIALSYAVIFGSLMWIAHRLRRTHAFDSYQWIFLAFGAFIVACGATHLMEVVTVWWPVYPLSAAVKVVCALASVPTAVVFARAAPELVAKVTRFVEIEAELRKANSELTEFSSRDALTGLTNRGKFDVVLASEWLRAGRSGISLSVVMMDIDHFKKLNDRYGHQAGDACLRQVAKVLFCRRGRIEDVTARYGGEEFALILPGSDLAAASRIAEEIRAEVNALEIPNEDALAARSVTLSIGVASCKPTFTENAMVLLAAADAALYVAKRTGRNRTESGTVQMRRVRDEAYAGSDRRVGAPRGFAARKAG
jgi:diguanylate cyclase (GGDEF)-like protein